MYINGYNVAWNLLSTFCQEKMSLEVTFCKDYMNRKSSLFYFPFFPSFLKANRKQISNKRLNTDPEEGVQRAVLHVLSNDHHRLA